jgi:hypothetical protein
VKTGIIAQVTQEDNPATVAIIGAIDHINQVTLFGLVFSLIVSKI